MELPEGTPEGVYLMEHAGFEAALMRAERLMGDHVHALPPGHRVQVYPIAMLPGVPDAWVREAGTYVCPVEPDWGLWFDWTMNDICNTAVVPVVKGMNPVTGLRVEKFGLEQFADKCPKHKVPFTHGRLCEKCGYEWPPQNYVCHPNTLWWDGFRQSDGSVRQFFFSDEEARDIASAVIGKENTVPAFGFAFHRPKNPQVAPKVEYRGFGGVVGQALYSCDSMEFGSSVCEIPLGAGLSGPTGPTGAKGPNGATGDVGKPNGITVTASVKKSLTQSFSSQVSPSSAGKKLLARSMVSPTRRAKSYASPTPTKTPSPSSPMPSPTPTRTSEKRVRSKTVAVGAGAKIRQELSPDALGVDDWKSEPGGVIRLYFCWTEQFLSIVHNGGVRELQSCPEGFLKDLPVG